MAGTTREAIRILCKNIITRLENNKAIALDAKVRHLVLDEVYGLVGPFIMSDEDLKKKALEMIGARSSELENTEFTESAQFRTAKAMVRKGFGDDELNGFYFLKNLRDIALMIAGYFMQSPQIDEVFETDDVLEQLIVETIKKFNPTQLH